MNRSNHIQYLFGYAGVSCSSSPWWFSSLLFFGLCKGVKLSFLLQCLLRLAFSLLSSYSSRCFFLVGGGHARHLRPLRQGQVITHQLRLFLRWHPFLCNLALLSTLERPRLSLSSLLCKTSR